MYTLVNLSNRINFTETFKAKTKDPAEGAFYAKIFFKVYGEGFSRKLSIVKSSMTVTLKYSHIRILKMSFPRFNVN